MLTLTILMVLLILVFAAVLLFGVVKIMWSIETIGNSPTSSAACRWTTPFMAERAGKAPVDYAPRSRGLEAIRELARRIGELDTAAAGSAATGRGARSRPLGAD